MLIIWRVHKTCQLLYFNNFYTFFFLIFFNPNVKISNFNTTLKDLFMLLFVCAIRSAVYNFLKLQVFCAQFTNYKFKVLHINK